MANTPTTCTRCLCDTTIPHLRFDESGVCNLCQSHDKLAAHYLRDREDKFKKLIGAIKKAGIAKKYDCIIGVSGGTDSMYTLFLAKQQGLRPLAIHFDNGWDKDVAVQNIKKVCDSLQIDLYTYVVNWEEFKNLQIAFLKASVPDIEVPTDIAIHGTLYAMARKYDISYILGGQCFFAEGTVPSDWSFIDGTYVKDIQKKFGTRPLKTYPLITVWQIAWNTIVRGIKQIPILNYVPYTKDAARQILKKEFGWFDYGGHHYENTYSHFAFGYYSLEKFGIDKRKISLSGPIRSGTLDRYEAHKQLAVKPTVPEEYIEYVIKKLSLTKEQFDAILKQPNKSFRDYRTSYQWLRLLRPIIGLAASAGLISRVVYEKFASN